MTNEQFKALERIWSTYGTMKADHIAMEDMVGNRMLLSLIESSFMERIIRGRVRLYGLTELGESSFRNEAQNRIQGTR